MYNCTRTGRQIKTNQFACSQYTDAKQWPAISTIAIDSHMGSTDSFFPSNFSQYQQNLKISSNTCRQRTSEIALSALDRRNRCQAGEWATLWQLIYTSTPCGYYCMSKLLRGLSLQTYIRSQIYSVIRITETIHVNSITESTTAFEFRTKAT